jgi:FkbM family methyltransferase
MIKAKATLVVGLEKIVNLLVQRIQLLFGYNSSEMKVSHIEAILKLSHLNPNKVRVLDGGANIGEFTDLLIELIPNFEGLCVEPQKSLVKKLNQKYQDTNIRCLPVGIGVRSGTAYLFLANDGDRKASLANQKEGNFSQEIEVRTLLEIISTEFPEGIDLLKLDLEGFDAAVLDQFFKSTPTHFPKVIILEISYLSNSTGFTPSKTYKLLRNNSYKRIFRTSPVFGLIPIELQNIRDFEGHTVNWVAILD